ncbi:hypothetical protein [Georgenia soli]|uniref:hypothetical protein n=1 Tax=Georgenia soli TaxID=638953 RepID=UPI0031833CDA
MSDLLALAHEEDRMKARGFVERSGMVICGGLPGAEMPQLTAAVPFSRAEQDLLIGWQDPPTWDPAAGQEAEPPGRGKFLVKVGGRPGIPIDVQLTEVETGIHDTKQALAHRLPHRRHAERWRARRSRPGRRRMSTPNNRRRDPGGLSGEAVLIWIGITWWSWSSAAPTPPCTWATASTAPAQTFPRTRSGCSSACCPATSPGRPPAPPSPSTWPSFWSLSPWALFCWPGRSQAGAPGWTGRRPT